MPKMKTRKGISKRFRKTSGGKLLYSHAFARHLMNGKSRKRKRKLRRASAVSGVESHRYSNLIKS